jgi:hypothetical protein
MHKINTYYFVLQFLNTLIVQESYDNIALKSNTYVYISQISSQSLTVKDFVLTIADLTFANQLQIATEDPIIGKDKDGKPIYAEAGSFPRPNNIAFIPEATDVIVGGSERAVKHLQVNNINEQQKIYRSEKGVPLTKKVQIKATDIKAELDHTLVIGTSIYVDAIAKLKRQFPKPAIIQSIFKPEKKLEIDYKL